jgi:hypothetical protein
MYRNGFTRTREAVRFVCTLPLFAISWVAAGSGWACSILVHHLGPSRKSDELTHKTDWSAEEFRFGQAIEKYAALIDSTARRQQ